MSDDLLDMTAIDGLGVCVLECPAPFLPDAFLAAVATSVPDAELTELEGTPVAWTLLAVSSDALHAVLTLRLVKKQKPPFYARLSLECSSAEHPFAPDTVERCVQVLRTVVRELRVGLVDFESDASLGRLDWDRLSLSSPGRWKTYRQHLDDIEEEAEK